MTKSTTVKTAPVLKHLILDKSGDYCYRTQEVGDVVEFRVSYDKGEYQTRRGIHVCVSAMNIKHEKHEASDGYPAHTNIVTSFSIVSSPSVRIFVISLLRKSEKAIAVFAGHIDAHVPEAARIFEQEGKAACLAFLKRVLFPITESAPAPSPEVPA